MGNHEDRKGDNSGGDDVLVWLCRDMDQIFEAIHAYLNGEATPFGGGLADWMRSGLQAVKDYACTRFLVVGEEGNRCAKFLRDEFRKSRNLDEPRITCELVTEDALAAMLAGQKDVVYVIPDNKPLPACLDGMPKYLFEGPQSSSGGNMPPDEDAIRPWPAGHAVSDLPGKAPAAWTKFFLPGSQELARKLENLRTIMNAKGKSGMPQYVLITGETGTGKSFITRNLPAICSGEYDNRQKEFNETDRKGKDDEKVNVYVQGNCAMLSPALADSLLFGAVDGTYTGRVGDVCGLIESAGKGILFLDEVGDLPLETQSKLLTALEEKRYYRLGDTGKTRKERRVECRIVFGTNRDLAAEAREWECSHGRKGFRRDLLYRINSFHIELPPLRERLSAQRNPRQRTDVLNGIVDHYCNDTGLSLTRRARETFDEFACKYEWPGNFRDVSHLFENIKVEALDRGVGLVVSAYAMKSAIRKFVSAETNEGAEIGTETLMEVVKARFPRPCDANEINFIFSICESARSCADAGRAYYGTEEKRNFPDAFGKRLAHFGLVFDKFAPGHLSEKKTSPANS